MSRTAGEKIERKYLAHFIDSSFGGTPSYGRLGKDLEELNIELNPDQESTKNIIGETSVNVKGYEPEYDVETYYWLQFTPPPGLKSSNIPLLRCWSLF